MSKKGLSLLVLVLIGVFGLILALSGVNHGRQISELKRQNENLENRIAALEYSVEVQDITDIAQDVRLNRLDVSLGFVQPPSPDHEWQPKAAIEGAGVSHSAFEESQNEIGLYISDLQSQIDYLQRWAENKGFTPGTLYDSPFLDEPYETVEPDVEDDGEY